MKSKGKRALAAALCCLLLLCALPRPVLAGDCFVLDVDALDMNRLNDDGYVGDNLVSRAGGLCVQKIISDSSELAEPVRLTIVRMDTETLLMDKDYGYQSKIFDSGEIYLTYSGSGVIPYLVTLYVGNTVYAMPFMQLQPRLELNSACTYGVRLRELGLSSDWLMGTMLDLNELRATGYAALDVCASNAYVIGQAVVHMQNNALCVELSMNPKANAEVMALSLYVLTDCAAVTGDPAYGGYPAVDPGEWTDVGGAGSALLYMPMQVSYDPAGLATFAYDSGSGYVQNQLALWNQNRSGASVFQPPATALPPEATALPWEAALVPATDAPPAAPELPTETAFPATPEAVATPTVPEVLPVQPVETALPEGSGELPEAGTNDMATVPEAASWAEPVPWEAAPEGVASQDAPLPPVLEPTAAPEPTPLPQPNGNAGFEG